MRGRVEPDNDPDFFTRMLERVSQRYRITADKSLRDVYRLDSDFLETESDADFAARHHAKILALLADPEKFDRLLELFINQTVEFTYASNQFVQIDAREEAVLRDIYTRYLRDLEAMLVRSRTPAEISAGMRTLVEGHFQDLRANLTRFFDPEARQDPDANVILQKVVCAEYSPELQLEILGLRLDELVEPVLDIGCGRSGRLVSYLQAAGIRAAGVDRVVADRPGLVQADWLDLPLQPGTWGTILSHLAFSNHFVFHHNYRRGSVEPYARQYMAILNALEPGGSFCYTPGLPFIEVYLPPEKYSLTRRPVPGSTREYASRVRRSPVVAT